MGHVEGDPTWLLQLGYGLSARAADNTYHFLPWDMLEDTRKVLRSPSNPDGLVLLGIAENPLLYGDITKFIKNNVRASKETIVHSC